MPTTPPTAWETLAPESRSQFLGWSTSGEFHCPCCPAVIARNPNDKKPFLLAAQHLARHAPPPEDA